MPKSCGIVCHVPMPKKLRYRVACPSTEIVLPRLSHLPSEKICSRGAHLCAEKDAIRCRALATQSRLLPFVASSDRTRPRRCVASPQRKDAGASLASPDRTIVVRRVSRPHSEKMWCVSRVPRPNNRGVSGSMSQSEKMWCVCRIPDRTIVVCRVACAPAENRAMPLLAFCCQTMAMYR